VVKQSLAVATAVMMTTSLASAAEIKVFSGGAPQPVLRVLAPEFEKASGHKVTFTFQIVSEIQKRLAAGEQVDLIKRLAAGEQVDLIMLPNQLIAQVEKVVPLRAEGRGVLARVGIGVIAREGATRPDISDEEGVRRALRAAKAIAIADPGTPSGRYLASMLVKLGLAEELKGRLIEKGAIHGGGELVAKGEADIGLYLVSEVRSIQGVTVVGLLPPALQSHVVYATAIPASNQTPQPALDLIRFLTASANARHWTQAGFEPAATP
jgi:molybdate transport system substrate-binding protein